jgi:hypothetical protein
MSTVSTIIKNLILPLVIKYAKVDVSSAPDTYWKQFASDFINYEIDAGPIYSVLYKLELQNPEDIFKQLPEVYSDFIKELAEEFVMGNEDELTDKLITNKNEYFLKEVSFLKTMKAVITKSERKELKKNLPKTYDRLVFELDEETLRQVAKKKSREDLRDKFKQWDEEMINEDSVLDSNHLIGSRSGGVRYSLAEESNHSEKLLKKEEVKNSTKSRRRVISLSWIKYAAAACIVLTAGTLYFKLNTDNNFVQPVDTNVVTAPVKKETITPEIPAEALAEVATVTQNTPVIESGLGFASKKNNIKILENNQKARMASIVTAIEKYRQLLENEFSENKVGNSSRVKELETKINSLQSELVLLKERDNHYIFDGKALVLYGSNFAKENAIVLYEDKYYLKRDADFYSLTTATQLQTYKKVTDTTLIEVLYNLYSE